MSDKYVEDGYAENGYSVGDASTIVGDTIGSVPLDFFVSNGSKEESELVLRVQVALKGENGLGLLQIPESNKIVLVSKTGFVSFFGQSETIEERLTVVENRVEEVANNIINLDIVMKAPDGTIIATPTVTRNGTSFAYDVPPEVAGSEYSVVVNVDICDGCGA